MSDTQIGLIGLGVMGKSLALNILDNGFSTSVYNRSEGDEANVVPDFLKENLSYDKLVGFTELEHFVSSLERPRKIILMIKAGKAIDMVINSLLPYLENGDIILDGGNSHYLDSQKRQSLLSDKRIHFIGCGISGGEEGARKGPAIMPGGNMDAYQQFDSVLNAIAAKDKNGNPCSGHIGSGGAGHFVKMVHNGIEYAEMQLLAELYHRLKHHMNYEEMAKLFDQWNESELGSYLLEITIDILRKKDGDDYLLDMILDKAGNKGTGSWSSKAGYDLGSAVTMMAEAVFARYLSSYKEERVRISIDRHEFNNSISPDLNTLRNAYQFARWINHIQGLELIRMASNEYNWGINISEVCRIWTNGCIIRSKMIETIMGYIQDGTPLLNHASLLQKLHQLENDCTSVISDYVNSKIPSPVFSNALNYWLSMTSSHLPANLIQAQRDYFGAHTYNRIDSPEDQFFHTQW